MAMRVWVFSIYSQSKNALKILQSRAISNSCFILSILVAALNHINFRPCNCLSTWKVSSLTKPHNMGSKQGCLNAKVPFHQGTMTPLLAAASLHVYLQWVLPDPSVLKIRLLCNWAEPAFIVPVALPLLLHTTGQSHHQSHHHPFFPPSPSLRLS